MRFPAAPARERADAASGGLWPDILPFAAVAAAYVGAETTLTLLAVPFATAGLGLAEARGLRAISAFWLGLLLQLTVATEMDLLPVAGRYDREYRDVVAESGITGIVMLDALVTLNGSLFTSAATHVLLPAMVVAAYPTGLIARLFRASLIETLGEEGMKLTERYCVVFQSINNTPKLSVTAD